MDDGARLSLSDVVVVLDLVKQRPHVFNTTFRVLDPLSDVSSEHIVPQIASTFSSHYSGSADVTSSLIDGNLVYRAWQLHRKLVQTSISLLRLAVVMEVSIVI